MTDSQFIEKIRSTPEKISFDETISYINQHYSYTPSRFSNGTDTPVINDAGSNEGSCKIFAFGLLEGLNEAQVLHCFGDFYRKDVLENPNGTDHANIRTFIQHGWSGIRFDQPALSR